MGKTISLYRFQMLMMIYIYIYIYTGRYTYNKRENHASIRSYDFRGGAAIKT